MKTFVTAIIVSHNSADFLEQTIAATKSQNVDQLIIVETGDAENPNAINYTIYTPIWTERGGYDKEMSEVALCPDNECGVIIS